MQGIYQGFELMTHDPAWVAALDLVQDEIGACEVAAALYLIMQSGNAGIVKE